VGYFFSIKSLLYIKIHANTKIQNKYKKIFDETYKKGGPYIYIHFKSKLIHNNMNVPHYSLNTFVKFLKYFNQVKRKDIFLQLILANLNVLITMQKNNYKIRNLQLRQIFYECYKIMKFNYLEVYF
jgi:hypothetical protein